jgi:hypothetical protein
MRFVRLASLTLATLLATSTGCTLDTAGSSAGDGGAGGASCKGGAGGTGGSAGKAGSGGNGAAGAQGGDAGAGGGESGAAGVGASGGAAGSGDPGGAGGASGEGGSSGTAGSAGTAGSGGASGEGGTAGASGKGGAGGTAGASGAAGIGGAGGSGGASGGGSGGAGGAAGGVTCASGYSDCDGNPDNGCEVNLVSTVTHCGQCDTVCEGTPNAAPTCVNGACKLLCAAGHVDCDGNYDNGCEAAPDSDPMNCGACGQQCPVAMNASATCAAATCGVKCLQGFDDCDGKPLNGCETATTTISNCGECGKACAAGPGATASCDAGVCGTTCNDGLLDCDGKQDNGCEIASLTDLANCGACGTACPAVKGAYCAGGVCKTTCTAPAADCDGNPANGCETDLETDGANCGACGHDCGGGACVGQKCQPVVLATGQLYPTDIALDADTVYWVNAGTEPLASAGNGEVKSIAKTGVGGEKLLANMQAFPRRIAVDSASVYFTAYGLSTAGYANGAVNLVSKSGVPGTALATGALAPLGITTAGGIVYWSEVITGKIKFSKAGDPTVTVAAGERPATVRVSNGTLFWTIWGAYTGCVGTECDFPNAVITSAPLAGGARTDITDKQPNADEFVVDGPEIYFIRRPTLASGVDGVVARVSSTGGPVAGIALNQPGARDVASDATHIYWTRGGSAAKAYADGAVLRVAKAGGTPEIITLEPGAFGLELDAGFVYYTSSSSGTVKRIAK